MQCSITVLSLFLSFHASFYFVLYIYLFILKLFFSYFQIGLKRAYPASMEESKKRAQVGTKVSKIANIFQGMPSRDEDDMRGSDVTVVRTESHLARFNNARALFEKLGEENRAFRIEKSPSAAASFAGTRGFPPAVPARSRSSSAGSVSPPRRTITPPASASAINGSDRLSNGASQPPPKPAKPVVLPKPDKPDRRFNKELIEKQRNWTAHFNKTKSSRHDHENKMEKHHIGYHDRKSPEVTERYVVPSRVYSPPLSPCAGDTQVERPTTLPSTFISRCTPGTKSPSPIKTVPLVTPTRSNNLVSSARPETVTRPQSSPIRSEKIISPTNTSDDRLFPRPESANRVFPRSRSIISPEKEDDKDYYREKDSLFSPIQTDCSVVTPKSYERVSSPLLTSSKPVIEPVSLPRHQKSTPTPTPRSPRTPPPITEEENSVYADLPQTSVQEDQSSPLENKAVDCPPSGDKPAMKNEAKPALPRPLPPVPVQNVNDHWSQVESEISRSPEPYEIVMSPNPETTSVDDDYEPVLFSSDVDEKSKRRSSTPKSPECTGIAEDTTPSQLTSPLASPVHHLSSSSPAAASPSPGKCLVSIYTT